MEANFCIRVTNFLSNARQLKSWKEFLEGKGFETIIVTKEWGKNIHYALYRNLSLKEEKEIATGEYVIVDESLKKAKNGIALKESERWK